MLRNLSPRRLAILTLLLGGLASGGQSLFIFAKAALAQILLRQAWQSGERQTPWRGADTWPVARLLVPRLGVDLIVLHGSSGQALAFGPGWLEASAKPGGNGQTMFAGHRDTHFSFLKDLRDDDLLIVETADHKYHLYRTMRRRVVADDAVELLATADADQLALVTCYPFEALTPGPLRFLAQATKVGTADALPLEPFTPATLLAETWRSVR